MKKTISSGGQQEFKLSHQILCVTSVDFTRQTIYGFVELHIVPLVTVLSRIKLNCRQCRIYRVCVKGSGLDSWLEAAFIADDPGNNVCSDGRKRSLDFFNANLKNAVFQTEADNHGGEITVRLPSETMPLVAEKKTLRLSIEFVLDRPIGGIHFVVPNGEGNPVERNCHMFSYKWGNSSRLWFPCIDSLETSCTWKIEVTVDKGMVAVCPGELVEKLCTPDGKRVTHHYSLLTPTSASNIGIAVGPFEIYMDPEMSELTYFCLPGLKPLLRHSTAFITEAFEFFEEALNTQYPYPSYKQVFVDQAYADGQSYASMSIFNTNLLHSTSVIEQPLTTRRVMVLCLAEQYFGTFVSVHSWADIWLIHGIAAYVAGLFLKKMFGNNEYRSSIQKQLQELCKYELDGPGLPPLYPFPLAASVAEGKEEDTAENPMPTEVAIVQHHPHLISCRQWDMVKTKAHLVMRMVELRVEKDLLLQALNKVLSLASSAAGKRQEFSLWSNMLISTPSFLKTISTVSGKDISVFLDQWVCHSGVAKFSASFSFNRKRNLIELEITQFSGQGCLKYVGPLVVSIQELDGSFPHTVQIEEAVSHHELPCHSKSRRNKKKKIPLVTGEEVDMDLSVTLDTDSPVLWIRLDPDMTWARHVALEQPDYMWQYQLRYERDVTSQLEAVEALLKYPSLSTRSTLVDIVNQHEAFYKVRIASAMCLAKVATSEADVWDGDSVMIDTYRKMFGSHSCPAIPRFNDFSNFVQYFLQKELPLTISYLRNVQGRSSKLVLSFLMDLLKYNDNRFNQFSDGNYVSSLLDAITNTIGPAVNRASEAIGELKAKFPVDKDAQAILACVVRHLNMEKILPSYKYSITCSCLKAIRCLQVNGHIPAESAIFRAYARLGLFEDIRFTALDCLIDFIKDEQGEDDFEWLLQMVEHAQIPSIRHHIVKQLTTKPPFCKKSPDSPLNTVALVERLWQLMNCDCANDYRLRCDLVDLYNVLWGTVTPSCLPSQGGLGSAFGLKEKKSAAAFQPSVDADIPLSADEERSRKKRRADSIQEENDSLNRPYSPSNAGSGLSKGSKIRLKIKLSEDSPHNSGSESLGPGHPSSPPIDAISADVVEGVKKPKKKKKKKHKHRKDKERDDFRESGEMGLSDHQKVRSALKVATQGLPVEVKPMLVDARPVQRQKSESALVSTEFSDYRRELSYGTVHRGTNEVRPGGFGVVGSITELMEDDGDDSDISDI